MSKYGQSSYDAPDMNIEKLTAAAARFRIPLPEDAGVVMALSRLDSTEAVPPELYSLIGNVLAFVHRVDGTLPVNEA